MEEVFERKCCIRGYHIYEEVWEAAVGEVFATLPLQSLFFNTFSTSLLARAMANCDGMWRLKEPSLVPRLRPVFRRCSTEKRATKSWAGPENEAIGNP